MQSELTTNQKALPAALDIEEKILGSIIVDSRCTDQVFSIVRDPRAFKATNNQKIFLATAELYQSGAPIDILTVTEQLKKMKLLQDVGGEHAIISLANSISSAAHVEYHCRILMQYFIKRQIIVFNNRVNALAYDDATDSVELLDRWQKEFDKVVNLTLTGRKTASFADTLDDLKKNIERLSNQTGEVPMVGVTTGFKKTDIHTGGYKEGDLVILAARPGMGKTSKVLKTVVENIKREVPVGFVSLEMSFAQLTARIMAIDSNFHLKQLLKSGFDKPQYFQRYDEHAERMKKYPLVVDDSGVNDITEIVILAKAWKRMHNIGLLVIDYLQLMGDKSIKGNRESEISSISRRMKLLAKELQIPVIALSQLSRAVETRGGSKRPQLSDLRDSGAIEQDADIVEFIYRPEYYDLQMIADDYDDPKHQQAIHKGGNAEVIFAKFRGGSTGTAIMRWVGDKTKFVDVEDENDTVEYIDKPLPKATPEQAFGEKDNDPF